MNNENGVDLGTLTSNELVDLRNVSDKIEPLKTNIGAANQLVKDIQQRLDQRLTDKEVDYFTKLNNHVNVLENDIANLASFKTWLDTTITAAEATETANQQASQNQEEYDGDNNVDSVDPAESEADDLDQQDVDDDVTGTQPGDATDPLDVSQIGVDDDVTGTTPGPSTVVTTPSTGDGIAPGVAGVAAGVATDVTSIDDEILDEHVEGEHRYLTAITDPLEEYHVEAEDYESLTDEERKAIVDRLRLVGYSEDEIKKFEQGGMGLPKVVVSNMASSLEETLRDNPELRQKLIDRYGFDIFYEDGTIDPAKLGTALLIDAKNSNDGFDLIKMLQNDYGVDLIDRGNLGQFATQINNAMEVDPELRQRLEEKYGFEIFNPDGTVNEDKLRYALMIDGFDSVDDLDLISSLYDSYGIDIKSLGSVDSLSLKLMEQLENDPQLRQKLIDKYGFDIVDENGTINMDKLRYALMLDTFDNDDTLDLLNLLHDGEMGNLSGEALDKLSVQLLSALELDPETKQRLIDLYGFDVFNEDGTVNMDRLKYMLMLDGIDLEDDLDVAKYLTEFLAPYAEDTETITKKKGNPIPIIAGIGLAAASAGAGYTIYKKNKEEEKESDEDEFYEDEDSDFEDEIDI